MANNKTLNLIAIMLQDCWGFFAMLAVSLYFKEKGKSDSPFEMFNPYKLIQILKLLTGCETMSTAIALKVVFTSIILSFFVSFILALLVFGSHVLFPKASKIFFNILLPFIVYRFRDLFENDMSRSVAILSSFIISAYGLISVMFSFDPLAYEISKKQVSKLFSQSYTFYLRIFSQLAMIVFDMLVIRLLDFSSESFLQNFMFLIYIISFLFSSSYSLRAGFIAYYAKMILPATEPSTLIDSLYYYLNSKCFALWKSVNMIFALSNAIYHTILRISPDQPQFFEFPRSSQYICTLKKKSFIDYMVFSKERAWHGDLRRKLKRVNIKEDLLPGMIISWIFAYSFMSLIQFDLIRVYESIIILVTHFLIIIEIFNSYIFVTIYKTSYGVDSLKLKSIEPTNFYVQLVSPQLCGGNEVVN